MARELTGRHVLAITVTAFAVIIAVNLVMAFKAVGTFPGLEVANSYVASQSFDAERAGQQGLGWQVTADYDGHEMHLSVLDAHGHHPQIASIDAVVGRPTHTRSDVTLDLRYDAGAYHAPITLAPGIWNIHITATTPDGTEFRQRLDHYAGAVVN